MIPPTAALPAKPTKLPKPKPRPSWTPEKSSELYGVDTWGHGFFGVNDDGHVTVKLADKHGDAHVSLHDVIDGLRDRGTHLPVLLRFRDLLHSRITEINEAFSEAITPLFPALRSDQPPFPRPPVRPNGSFRVIPQKANS